MTASRSLILSGFKEDCEKLITSFEEACDIRFETFCQIWREMKFSLVFAGRPSFLELLEFCEEALNVCKQFVLSPPRFKERIAGLYLLYGVYYKMPIEEFKIRVNSEDWQTIMELHLEIKRGEHLDANYVLCKMIADNAFHYSIFDTEFALEKSYRTKNSQCFNPFSVFPILKDLCDNDRLLARISTMSEEYDEKKKSLQLDSAANTNLNYFNPNVAIEIARDIKEFEEERRNQESGNASNTENTPGASTSKEEQTSTPVKSVHKGKRPLIEDASHSDLSSSDDNDVIDLCSYDSESPECID